MSPMHVKCCICGNGMDFNHRYGRNGCCCGKACFDELEWRATLSICDKAYYPDPRRFPPEIPDASSTVDAPTAGH